MAANLKDEEERNRRIILVGEFIINNPNMSTRKIAKYFSDNYFKISNATVHDYLVRYRKMVLENKDKIDKIMYENKGKGISDAGTVSRVKEVTKKFIEEDKTMEQIAEELNINFWTVYRDLKVRLPLLDKEAYEMVEKIIYSRMEENLNKKNK